MAVWRTHGWRQTALSIRRLGRSASLALVCLPFACPRLHFVFTVPVFISSDQHQIMHVLCPRTFCTALESWRHTDSPHVTPRPPPLSHPHPVTGQRGPLWPCDWPAKDESGTWSGGGVGLLVLFSIAALGLWRAERLGYGAGDTPGALLIKIVTSELLHRQLHCFLSLHLHFHSLCLCSWTEHQHHAVAT